MTLGSRPGVSLRILTLALALAAAGGCHDRPEADAPHEGIAPREPITSREHVEAAPSRSVSADATPDALAREVLAALEATPLAGKLHYEKGPFELVAADGFRVSLGNLRI